MSLLKLLPLWKLDAWMLLLFGHNRRAKMHAWLWIFTHPLWILHLRCSMQKTRVVDDTFALAPLAAEYFSPDTAERSVAKRLVNRVFCVYAEILGL